MVMAVVTVAMIMTMAVIMRMIVTVVVVMVVSVSVVRHGPYIPSRADGINLPPGLRPGG